MASGEGVGKRGSTERGIPTVRLPRLCRLSRSVASFTARSPASEWILGGARVGMRAQAAWTWSTKGRTGLGSRGLPTGSRAANTKPVAGSPLIPGLRPNGVGQLLLPVQIGASIASEAWTILQQVRSVLWVRRRD